MSLSEVRMNMAAASIGGFVLICYGWNTDTMTPSTTVDVYDDSLTRTNRFSTSIQMEDPASVDFGDYALFSGGENSYTNDGISDVEVISV